MYEPEHFGELGVVVSVVGLFGIIATFQYESAIMLPKKDEEAFNILILTIGITILVSAFSFIVLYILKDYLKVLLKSNLFNIWVFIIPIFVILTGLYNSFNIWASRRKKFKRLAFRQVAQTTVGGGSKLILGGFNFLDTGLIFGTLVGQFTSTFVLIAKSLKDSKNLFRSVTLKLIKNIAFRYKNFPKYTMFQGFFDLINTSGLVFLISYFFGLEIVGLYSFALGLLYKPTMIIGQSVSQVYYQQASVKINNGESILNESVSLIKKLSIIGLLIFLPILLFGSEIFSFVFGVKWFEAGQLARIIAPWIFLKMIVYPLSVIPQIYDLQRKYFIISTIANLFSLGCFYVLAYFNWEVKMIFVVYFSILIFFIIVIVLWIKSIMTNNLSNKVYQSSK